MLLVALKAAKLVKLRVVLLVEQMVEQMVVCLVDWMGF